MTLEKLTTTRHRSPPRRHHPRHRRPHRLSRRTRSPAFCACCQLGLTWDEAHRFWYGWSWLAPFGGAFLGGDWAVGQLVQGTTEAQLTANMSCARQFGAQLPVPCLQAVNVGLGVSMIHVAKRTLALSSAAWSFSESGVSVWSLFQGMRSAVEEGWSVTHCPPLACSGAVVSWTQG